MSRFPAARNIVKRSLVRSRVLSLLLWTSTFTRLRSITWSLLLRLTSTGSCRIYWRSRPQVDAICCHRVSEGVSHPVLISASDVHWLTASRVLEGAISTALEAWRAITSHLILAWSGRPGFNRRLSPNLCRQLCHLVCYLFIYRLHFHRDLLTYIIQSQIRQQFTRRPCPGNLTEAQKSSWWRFNKPGFFSRHHHIHLFHFSSKARGL